MSLISAILVFISKKIVLIILTIAILVFLVILIFSIIASVTVNKINWAFDNLIDSDDKAGALEYFEELIQFREDAFDYNKTLTEIAINSGKQDHAKQSLLEQVCRIYNHYDIRSSFSDILQTANLKNNNIEEFMRLRFLFNKSIQRALGLIDRDWQKYYIFSQIFEDVDICLAIYLNSLALEYLPKKRIYLSDKLDILTKLAKMFAHAGSIESSLAYYKYILNFTKFHPLPVNKILEINRELFILADRVDSSAQIVPILLLSPRYYRYTLSTLPLINYTCIRARDFEKNLLYMDQVKKHVQVPDWLCNILHLQSSAIKFLLDNRENDHILESDCLNLLLNEIENIANQNDQIKLAQLIAADTFLALGSSSKAILYLERAQKLTLSPLVAEDEDTDDFEPEVLEEILKLTELSARLNLSVYNSEEEALFDLYTQEGRYREAQNIAERTAKKYSQCHLEFAHWQIKLANLKSLQVAKDKDEDIYKYAREVLENIANYNHFDQNMIRKGENVTLDSDTCQGPYEYYVYLSKILRCNNSCTEESRLDNLYDMIKICGREPQNVPLLREIITAAKLLEHVSQAETHAAILEKIATNVRDLTLINS